MHLARATGRCATCRGMLLVNYQRAVKADGGQDGEDPDSVTRTHASLPLYVSCRWGVESARYLAPVRL
eukprot:409736-Prorocentrum_minimum.AAC.1